MGRSGWWLWARGWSVMLLGLKDRGLVEGSWWEGLVDGGRALGLVDDRGLVVGGLGCWWVYCPGMKGRCYEVCWDISKGVEM